MRLLLLGYVCILALEYVRFVVPMGARIAMLLSLTLTVVALVRFGIGELARYPQVKALGIFLLLTALAMLHGLLRLNAYVELQAHVGYALLMLIGYYAMRDQVSINRFAAFFVLMHAGLGFINLPHYWEAERVSGYLGSYFTGDGNDFGWAMVIAAPLGLYLSMRSHSMTKRMFWLGCFLMIAIGAVGTQSRGASLALAAALFYFWIAVSKRKTLGFVALGILALGVIAYAPAAYVERMQTITQYEQDSSAMGRIAAWKNAVEMAVDHPLLGVGAGSFNSAYGRYYRDPDEPQRWISAHSIYFKTLGEYGFPGLFLLLYILYRTWRRNRELRRELVARPGEREMPDYLPEVVNSCLIGYAVGGAFLTGINYPHLYVLLALCLSVDRLAREQAAAVAETQTEPGLPERSPVFSGAWQAQRLR